MPEYPSNLPCSKSELRESLRMRRKNLDPGERRELSRAAAAHIVTNGAWREAGTVALYMAVRGETDTSPLILHAWENGKTVLLPVCSETQAGSMRFASCSGMEALAPGPFGIPEPLVPSAAGAPSRDTDACAKGFPSADAGAVHNGLSIVPDIIIVPGLAFDANGTRLGMGGGYYDRLLALPRYADSLRLGLAYSFQLVNALPREEWDIPVHAVCTELGILWTTSAQGRRMEKT